MLTRRQFLSYTAALGAATAFSWQTYKYLNRKPPVSINRVGLPLGHLLRDGELINQPTRRYECNTLILGGGAAGLGALWYLAKHNHCDVLLAEGFERNGNNAAYTSSAGLKAPSGAHYLALPSKESVYVREMLADFG
ncbi:NAD(P)-binding protein, partial [Neisseria sp. P0017.S010]